MKKNFRIVLITVLSLSFIFGSTLKEVHAIVKPPIKPLLWPGRPGGNGDGSEEFMNGLKYGEMRGPWVFMSSSHGTTESLRRKGTTYAAIANAIIGITTTVLTATVSVRASINAAGLVGFAGIVDTFINSNTYPGSTYSLTTYGSGRRLKQVYKFFDGDGYEITTKTSYIHY